MASPTPLPFSGPARALTTKALPEAAAVLNTGIAEVAAVRSVEAAGSGFLADGSGRPKILFEAHRFSAETNGRYDASHPRISSPSWNRKLYASSSAGEYDRLMAACALDRRAALRSASWGAFQIMGSNHIACGFADVEAFVAAMGEGEEEQLDAFVGFLLHEGLDGLLRRHEWARFAARYNGPRFAENRYDEKLADAYAAESRKMGLPTTVAMLPAAVLRIGSKGVQVRELQTALRKAGYPLTADGDFGRMTEITVQRFQASKNLRADGIVGPVTARALGLL